MFVHIAEPSAFYDPADESNELRRSENWLLHGKGTPGFAAMLEKFERVLSRHPRTRFVSVHAFNLANDLGAVGALLDRHPNVQVDFAARMWELARQPFTARKFFVKYQDRILFGTDMGPERGMYLAHARQLETEDEWFWPADAEWWRGYGMKLSPGVLGKVYRANAERLLAASGFRTGLHQQVAAEVGGEPGDRPANTGEVPARHVVAHGVAAGGEPAQLDLTLEARGVERVVEPAVLLDGVRFRTVEADVVEVAEVLALGEPLLVVHARPLRPRLLARRREQELRVLLAGRAGPGEVAAHHAPRRRPWRRSPRRPSLSSTWSPK